MWARVFGSTLLVLELACSRAPSAPASSPPGVDASPAGGSGGAGAAGGTAGAGATGATGAAAGSGGEASADSNPGMIRLFARSYPKWIALSEDYVYWNEEGTVNVMRGPKTGGTVEEVGPWSGVGAIFAVDETHIYWLNDDRILKREHQGGPITEIPLGASYLRGSIFGYADMLYVADTGCRTILRVAKQGGSPTVTQVSGAELLGGVTRVIVDANDLYCGAGGAGKIYAQPRAGGEVRTFLSGQDSVGAMALDETTLYWVNNRGNLGLRLQNLALASRTDGVASDLGTVMPAGHAAFLNLDQARRTLYWVTGISAQLPLMKYSLDDRAFTAVADKRWMRGGFAADRDYLYWTEDDAIMKMAK